MYTSYSIWLILTSIILLLAMTGAIVITIKQKDNINNKYSWDIKSIIELKDIDISLLNIIKEYFGVGKFQIIKNKDHAVYVVNSIKDICNVIISHFDKYSLLTVKRLNFLLFKEILFLIRDKKHLTENGLQRIISIRALMNKKTSITSYTYPLIAIDVPVLPLLKTTDVTPEWLAGFTDA